MPDWSRGTLEGDNGSTYTWTVFAIDADRTSYTLTVYEDDVQVYTESFAAGVSQMDIWHFGVDKVYELGGVYDAPPEIIYTDPDTGETIVVNNDDPLYDYYKGLQAGQTAGSGIDHGKTSIANVAGYWTVGVAKGMAIMFVPVVVVSVAVGFMTRVVKVGTRIGGA